MFLTLSWKGSVLQQLVTWPLFHKHADSAEYIKFFSRNKKSSLKYATMPIFVSISFKTGVFTVKRNYKDL